MRHLQRRVMGGVIVAAWVGMMGLQARREYFQPELTRLAEAALSLAPGVNFYTLKMGDRSVGLATSRLDTLPDGFELEDVMSLELPALGQTGTAVVRTRVKLSPALRMQSFSFSLDSEVGRYRADGTVTGDTLLEVAVESGGSIQELSYRLEEPPIFSAILPIRIAMGGDLKVGERVRVPVFDPSALATRAVEVRVVSLDTLLFPDSAVLNHETGRWAPATYDTVPTWKISEMYGGVVVESWVDEDGRIVKAASPLGFSMERTEYELARQAQEDARLVTSSPIDDDVILSTAIASNVDLGAAEQHQELKFRLTGVDLEGFELDGGRQELRGDTLIIRRENWGGLSPDYTLPYKLMDLRDALEPEPLIQSADERIISAARQVTAWSTRWQHDPKEIARQLTRSVYGMLDKQITLSVPSALQVLETKRGDCNEHTVLYVAMARALGLPARTAVGLVYLNGSFFYHAWPEVWLDEWVAVDPTFGQWPADAAHIRFVIGGLAQQVDILRLIGRLGIEVITDTSTSADEDA